MSPRRLLVVSYDFGAADGRMGGMRWAGITKYLTRLGWEVVVLTAAPPGRNEAVPPVRVVRCRRLWTLIDASRLLRRLTLRRSLEWLPNDARIARSSDPSGLLRRLRQEVMTFLAFPDESRGWVCRAALRARSVVRRFQPHVVVSSGPPHSAHLVAGVAMRGSAARWLIDLQDPWAGPLTQAWASHPRLGTWVYRAGSARLERLTFRAADGVITVTHQLAAALGASYPDVPIVCVPNGVDAEGLPRLDQQRFPGLSVAYAGRLYGSRDLGPVVRALGMFLQRHPEAGRAGSRLRIAGPADSYHTRVFKDAVAAAGAERYVEMLGVLPRAEALSVVARSRLAVVLAQEQELQIPAKLYESVAMGVPTLVVASADSAAGVEGRRLGAVVRDSADVDGITCVLERLWQDGAREPSPCPVPITYDAIALLVDQVLGMNVPLASAREGVAARL